MKDKEYLAWLADILDDEPQRANCDYSYRKTRALEIIARCQMRQTEIAEQSFEEAKELRDYTMKMMKKEQDENELTRKLIDERVERVYGEKKQFPQGKELLKSDSN